jgi:site-specific DNA recombinase
LFYDVQDFLDGKKKNYRTKVGSQEILQLRGYLLCPKCGKLLTGSASKGNGGQYYYYHCASSCGARFKAENANDLFCRELRKYIPRPGMEKAYAHVLNTAYKARTKTQREEIKAIGEQIEAANLEVARGRKLLLKEEIDGQDFREIKRENEQKIDMLESKLIEMTRVATNIEPMLEKAVSNLGHLDQLYKEGDVKGKRVIIGSIYPEKLTFDGFQYRTTRVNEAVELIYALDKGFTKNETGQTKEVFDLSSVVAPRGLSPSTRPSWPADPSRICITQVTSSGSRRMVFFRPSALASKLASLPCKKIPLAKRGVTCCPTRIRTSTNRTKICRTTIILWGNPFL